MAQRINDPEYWFLCRADTGRMAAIADEDQDTVETGLNHYTTGNHLELFIDGDGYFKALHDVLTKTPMGPTATQFVHVAGYSLAPGLKLLYADGPLDEADARCLLGALANVAGGSSPVRVLLSAHGVTANLEVVPKLKGVGIQCLRDARYPNLGAAHQKLVVSSLGGKLHAFCGGIDLDIERWDDRAHSGKVGRQHAGYPGGWHDVHCGVRGLAARDLEVTFRQRWHDTLPTLTIDDPCAKADAITASLTDLIDLTRSGTHAVQVLRTYACNTHFPGRRGYDFAPDGEDTAYKARLQAIAQAEDYIYIEDQYFYSDAIADAIIRRLSDTAVPNLRVIVLIPLSLKGDHLHQWAHFRRDQIKKRIDTALAGTSAAGRFAVYHLVNRSGTAVDGKPIYIHNKMMLVDDAWAMIGSMNCNRRSASHDLELALGIVDTAATPGDKGLVRALRIDLWSEHLGLLGATKADQETALGDPREGFELWRAAADDPSVHAVGYRAPGPNDAWNPLWLWDLFYDPTGTCDGGIGLPSPLECP